MKIGFEENALMHRNSIIMVDFWFGLTFQIILFWYDFVVSRRELLIITFILVYWCRNKRYLKYRISSNEKKQ